MKIISNATSAEISSPFYKANRSFCFEFENYIANKHGIVKGSYNAWSYLIFGKITSPKNWTLMYKKSTYTSTGNLLLSSKDQCLVFIAEWETEIKDTHKSRFLIRKKNPIDFIRKIISSNITELGISDKYILEMKNHSSQLISKLTIILKNLFLSGEIFKIVYRNSNLKIEMRTEKHHFETFEKLIDEI